MGPTIVLRSLTSRVAGAATMAVAALGVGSLLMAGQPSYLASYGVALAALGLFGWAVFWAPYVEVSDGGVVLRNVVRTVHLPWPAIQEVDGRYGLRLSTAYGRFSAWAAPAPAGRDRLAGGESEAATSVRQRRNDLAAYLTDPRLERNRPVVRWHWLELAAAACLLLIAVLGPRTG